MFPDTPSIFGSMQLVTGKSTGLESGLRLPDWPDEGTDSSLRDVEEEYPNVPISMPGLRATNIGAGSASGFGSSHMSSSSVTPVVLTPTGTSPNLNQGTTSGKGAWTDLDKFYEESEEESSEEEEEESEEEEGSDTHSAGVDKPLDSHEPTRQPDHEESEESAESDDSDDSDDSSD